MDLVDIFQTLMLVLVGGYVIGKTLEILFDVPIPF